MGTQPSFIANVIELVFELVGHNYIVLSYFAAFLAALFFAIKRPTRVNLLLVIGLSLLIFNFEYEKHISEGLRLQTEQSLTRGASFQKVRTLTKIIFEFMLPVGSYIVGWALIIYSLYKTAWQSHHTHTQ